MIICEPQGVYWDINTHEMTGVPGVFRGRGVCETSKFGTPPPL